MLHALAQLSVCAGWELREPLRDACVGHRASLSSFLFTALSTLLSAVRTAGVFRHAGSAADR